MRPTRVRYTRRPCFSAIFDMRLTLFVYVVCDSVLYFHAPQRVRILHGTRQLFIYTLKRNTFSTRFHSSYHIVRLNSKTTCVMSENDEHSRVTRLYATPPLCDDNLTRIGNAHRTVNTRYITLFVIYTDEKRDKIKNPRACVFVQGAEKLD